MSALAAETCSPESNADVASGVAPATHPAAPPLDLREVRLEDGPAVHARLRAAIPGTLSDLQRWLRRWRWQCLDNPFRGQRPAGWVLVDGEAVVGHIGVVYLPLRVGAGRRIGQVVADYVVSPEATARGGLFAGLRLAQAFMAAAEGQVPLATTANDKTGAVLGRYGCRPVEWTRELWRAPATPEQEIRSCLGGASRVVRRLLRAKAGAILGRAAGGCCRLLGIRPRLPLPAGCRLEVLEAPAIQELEYLASMRLSYGATCSIDWSADYLDWRYARHPEWKDTRVLVLRRFDGRALGGAVVFCERLDERRIAFVEELAAPRCSPLLSSKAPPGGAEEMATDAGDGEIPLVRALLIAALRAAVDLDADYLVATAGRGSYRSLFWELGFESRARNAPALVLPEGIAADPAFQHGMMF
ncbi:MAG: hypothetical protein KA354_17345 [Phycisphaerae bacterium]|nr:hypothetical protein [Phycisphaerae bacterium]